jgi:hypothetical protein
MFSQEELLNSVRKEIFGAVPDCKYELIGYNVATSYFNPLIEEAEKTLLGFQVPSRSLILFMQNAFVFSSYDGFAKFPPQTRQKIKECAERFQKRYMPLVIELMENKPKAA